MSGDGKHRYGPHFMHAIKSDHELMAIGQLQHNAVVGSDPKFQQSNSETIHLLSQGLVGQTDPVVDNGDPVGELD